MYLIFRFVIITGIGLGIVTYTIGWLINSGHTLWVISHKGWVCLTVFLLYGSLLLVSYLVVGSLSFVNTVLSIVKTLIIAVFLLAVLRGIPGGNTQGELGFTHFGPYRVVVGPDVRYGPSQTRYTLCMLEGSKYCLEYKALNLLFYKPYQLCNLSGKLLYKDISKIKTYDIVKNRYLEGKDLVIECEDTLVSTLFGYRDMVINRIDRLIQKPQSSLLSGIIFGLNLSFSDEFADSVKAAGINHIIAASGYNVTILVVALSSLTKKLPEKVSIIIYIFFIWIYAMLTGFSSSMVRASAMSSASFISKLFNLGIDSSLIFWLTVSVLILFKPVIVFDLGFLLSVAATSGLIYLTPKLQLIIKSEWFPHTTLACTLATLPITLLHFQTVSIYSVLANMIILPVIEVVMLVGILGLVVTPLIYIAWGALKFVQIVAQFFYILPFSIIQVSPISSVFISLGFIFLIVLILRIKGGVQSDINNS